jgi:recombination protein RecA
VVAKAVPVSKSKPAPSVASKVAKVAPKSPVRDTADSRALAEFEKRMEKSYGAGRLTTASDIIPYKAIPTGSLTFDYALGIGGVMCGRLHEWWGQDGIAKTSMSFLTMAQAQRFIPDRRVAFLDVEHKGDRNWMRTLGVDLDRCKVFDPDDAQDVADALKEIIRSGLFSLVVLDSIGAMIPEQEIEKDSGDATVGLQAKIVTRMVKIAAGECARYNTAVIFVNQVRAAIGAYGKTTTTGGGWALRHCTTTKVEFKRTGTPVYKTKVAGEEIQVGHEIAAKVERNGVAPAYKTAMISFFNQNTTKYGPVGVDQADEAFTLGTRLGVIQQTGGWYTLPTGERFQGGDKVSEYLREHRDEIDDIRERIIATKADEVFAQEMDPTVMGETEATGFRKGTSAAKGES